MHYLTLLKIYKSTDNDLDKSLVERLDSYIFKKDKLNYEIQLHPFDLYNDLNLKNTEEENKLLYILRLAQKMGMFELVYEAYCPNRLIPIREVPPDAPYFEMTDEDCSFCGECYHKIMNDDFVVSFRLIEKPTFRNLFNILQGKRSA